MWQPGWFGTGVTPPVNETTEMNCYSPDNISFPGDGSMHLDVTADPSSCGDESEPYTGAMVTTNPSGRRSGGFQYTYGVLEALVYVPAAAAGSPLIADWPAVWTDGQSWPADGEDDLMEGQNGVACWDFHDPLGVPRQCDPTITPGWHTFASDWEPGSVTYYYDGVDEGTITTGITSAPMFIALDNTVHTAEPGVTVAATMQVKYVRVWQ